MKKIFCILLLIIVAIANKSCLTACACGTPPSHITYFELTNGKYFYPMYPIDNPRDSLAAYLPVDNSDIDSLIKFRVSRNINKVAISQIYYTREHRNSVNRQVGDSVKVGVLDSITLYILGEEDKTYKFILEYEDETN